VSLFAVGIVITSDQESSQKTKVSHSRSVAPSRFVLNHLRPMHIRPHGKLDAMFIAHDELNYIDVLSLCFARSNLEAQTSNPRLSHST
jgi:hypothetical protein